MPIAVPVPLVPAPSVETMTRKRKAPRVTTDWNVLLEAMFAEPDALDRRVRDAIRTEYAVDRTRRFDALHDGMAADIVRILSAARAGRAGVDNVFVADLATAGEAWARQGIPVDEMLQVWHVGVEVILGYLKEVGQRRGVDDADLLEFVQSVYGWSDVAVVAAAKGHRSAEIELAVAEEERREAFVRGLLFGTLASADLRVGAEAYGLDPDCEYIAVRARLGNGVHQRKLEQELGFHAPGKHRAGLSAVVDGSLAGILIEPPVTMSALVGVGPRRSLRHVAESYRLATRALMTIQACGLRGAHDFGSLGLRAAVAMDSEVGEILRQRYLDPMAGADSARELLSTLRAYLACDMHVERTATRLFVHQNTVRYRLARFEELTGTSLRSTQVVVELWWALALSEMDL